MTVHRLDKAIALCLGGFLLLLCGSWVHEWVMVLGLVLMPWGLLLALIPPRRR